MDDIERELIIRASEGDGKAFEEIYRRTSGFVYSLAFRITNRKQEAEEVTQDVFWKVYKSLQGFKFESSFKTWLYRIAVNTALNRAKQRSRVTVHELEDPEGQHVAVVPAEAARGLEMEEAEKRLQVFLEQLNPDQRACILLREIGALDYREIAESLGININTVRSRLKRAREALMVLGKKEVASHGM